MLGNERMAMERLKEELISLTHRAGAQKTGFAAAHPVREESVDRFNSWLSEGKHGGMAYMKNYPDIRQNPRLLLNGINPEEPCTLMVCAFSYYHTERQTPDAARIAMYAHGSDYHEVLRQRLQPVLAHLDSLGIKGRICIDSAPLRERYWAVEAGIGFIGRNGQLIVDGVGSYVFLATVIFNAHVSPDEPCRRSCLGCRRCLTACPGQAIGADGDIDARRCVSYLTIEHRGDLPDTLAMPDGTSRPIAGILGNRVYGCDECQRVCPHNRRPLPTGIAEFHIRPSLRTLSHADILNMTQPTFSTLFRHSPVKRTRLAGLIRNARPTPTALDPII